MTAHKRQEKANIARRVGVPWGWGMRDDSRKRSVIDGEVR